MRDVSRRHLLQAALAAPLSLTTAGSSFAQNSQEGTKLVQKAKRVVYLFQAGGPSQLEMFDPKPGLAALRGTELPDSVRRNARLTTMTSGGPLTVANALLNFAQHGQSGMWVSELFPHIASIADDLCLVRSMRSDAVNHDPATNLALTGSQLTGMPSIGAWLSLALGNENPDLPTFLTMTSSSKSQFTQPLGKRLWGSAFLPVEHQGVNLRPGSRPVLYLDDGTQLPGNRRRELYDTIQQLNQLRHAQTHDPEILRRSQAYEIASRMEHSLVELADVQGESEDVLELYGPQVKTPGTYAANCLRARRLLERGARFVQLMHKGWDHHYTQTEHMRLLAEDTDQPTAGFIKDLQRTGLLDETLVVWGGEFGRTAYSQGEVTADDHGRDHHPHCFNVLLAGAGVRAGTSYGETDDFSFNIVKNPVHVHDLHATILHLVGVDHRQHTFHHQGRDHRLTDIGGNVVHDILS